MKGNEPTARLGGQTAVAHFRPDVGLNKRQKFISVFSHAAETALAYTF